MYIHLHACTCKKHMLTETGRSTTMGTQIPSGQVKRSLLSTYTAVMFLENSGYIKTM